jgi:hypothetical protein
MTSDHHVLVRVQGAWNGWQTAEVRLSDLEDVHWLKPGRAPQPLVHGYVACSSLLSGAVPHDCDRTPAPHRLLVCVIKHHNIPSVYAEVVLRAIEAEPTAKRSRAADALPQEAQTLGNVALANRRRSLVDMLFNRSSTSSSHP